MADGHRTAVDVEGVVGDAELALEHQWDTGEGLVDLEKVDVADVESGALQCLARGVEDRGELDHRIGRRHRLDHEPRPRGQPVVARVTAFGDEQRRGTVADLRGVRGGGAAVGGEDGAQAGHLLGVEVFADALVGGDRFAVVVQWVAAQRHHLLGEASLDGGGVRSFVTAPAERVEVVAIEIEPGVHQLAGRALCHEPTVVAGELPGRVLRAEWRAGLQGGRHRYL